MQYLMLAYPCVLFLVMVLAMRLGHRIMRRRIEELREGSEGGAAIDGAVFALLGLLLAFTFSNAYSRFGIRRGLITEEANNIGTAYLRLDVIEPEAREPLKKDFVDYVEARLAFWQALPDADQAWVQLARASSIQQRIWDRAVAAVGQTPRALLVLAPLNEMIDIVTTRTSLILQHPPHLIFGLLFLLAVGGAWIAGADMWRSRQLRPLQTLLFPGAIAATAWLILDIEYPSFGFVQLGADHWVLERLLTSFRGG
jgi:hypothetical protein